MRPNCWWSNVLWSLWWFLMSEYSADLYTENKSKILFLLVLVLHTAAGFSHSLCPPAASTACHCWREAQTPLAIYKPAVMVAMPTCLVLCWGCAPIHHGGVYDIELLVFCSKRDNQDIKRPVGRDSQFVMVKHLLLYMAKSQAVM